MLSDAKARQISPGGKAPAAGGITGSFLYPSARRGEGKWILRLVSPVTGKRRDLGLGACPGTGIALARQLGAEARTLIAEGKDPIEALHRGSLRWRVMFSVCAKLFQDADITPGRLLLRFVILTACRSGEARSVRWEELTSDKGVWSVPVSRMKAKAMRRVPLSPRAQEIVQHMAKERDGSPYVFPSRKGTPLSDMTLTKILQDAGFGSASPVSNGSAP